MDYNKSKMIQDIYSLTSLQEGMLFDYLADESNDRDIAQQLFCVKEVLNENYLIQSLKLISIKYAAIRTSIMYQGMTKPRQVVLKERDIEYEKIDCVNRNEDPENILKEIIDENLKRGFDLQKDTLLRVSYISFSDDINYMLLTNHHIILDGWSNSIVINDICMYYTRLSKGDHFEQLLYECEVYRKSNSYGEFIQWIYSQDKNSALTYWKELCQNYNGSAEIVPMTEERKIKEKVQYEELSLHLDLTNQLMQIAKKNNVTMNNIFEAAWGMLLQKYNNSNDVIFGKVVSGREAPIAQIEHVVGMFINTIPFRVTVNENMTVEQLLHEVKKQGIDGKNYEYCSLAEIQSALLSKENYIKTIVAFQNFYKIDLDSQLEMESVYSRQITTYSLSVNADVREGRLRCRIRYNPIVYDREEIKGLLDHLVCIFDYIAYQSREYVKNIEMCTQHEYQRIQEEFNHTKVEYPKDKTIIELFEEQVKRSPNVCAIKVGNHSLTYQELNQKANLIGKHLRTLGIGSDHLVGIIADRSIEMIVGMYGILKAGGAYLPIDPEYPIERVKYILEDSKPGVLLISCKKELQILEELSKEIKVVNIYDVIQEENTCGNLVPISKPDNLAYVIYTSGTTGKPKGVLLENRSVVNYCSMNERNVIYDAYSEGCRRIISVTNMTFDIFVTEIILSLINGMTVYLTSQQEQEDYEAMCSLIDRENIEILQTTPTRMKLMINTGKRNVFSKLKYVLLGGEVVDKSLIRQLEELTDAKLKNVYGPTETTVWSTMGNIYEMNKISIGKPIANTEIYIMQNNHLCGIGVIGELCIAGEGLARGYLNREDLTDQKFVQKPDNQGLMYRTGDLARWLPDGNLEFLGRKDDQVKVRGYRIELGEIESHMMSIPNIKECAVVVDCDSHNDNVICAYFVSDTNVNIIAVRDELCNKLPDYMIPSCFMQIAYIPVTSSGKLDKRALPKIQIKSYREFVAPGNVTEFHLCQIFGKVLSVDQVGIEDDFFELGGHSLKAMRLINQIEAELKIHLGIHEVFDTPTVKELSDKIKKQKEKDFKSIPKVKDSEYYPMSSAQKRIYMVCQFDRDGISYNIPQIFRLQGMVDIKKIERSIAGLINRHEILRTEFTEKDGELLQHIRKTIDSEYFEYIEDTQTAQEELVQKFIRPFCLGRAPLLRAKVVKRESDYLLMIDMHHIVSDGTSNGIFLNELSREYNGERIETHTHQYRDYSEWMRTRDLTSQKKYWENQFVNEAPVLDLPLDYLRQHEQSFRGQLAKIEIDHDIILSMKQLMREDGVSEYMIFLSAAMILLGKYSKQDDIVIGSPISARTHKDTEKMMGMFVNTLALRANPCSHKTFEEFLAEIRNLCFRAYENCEYPFEELVEIVNVKRELSRNPLFDVMLALHNNEDAELFFQGIQSKYVKNQLKVSKFDLSFNISQYDDQFILRLRYCSDLFTRQTANKMIQQFVNILGQVTKNKGISISDIDILLEDDKHMIFEQINHTDAYYPQDKTIVDLFEEQAARTPNNIAVRYDCLTITYEELNQKANQLARKLRAIGVKPNDFVVIIAKRSIEMLVAVYGILKAGGAYVPISPSYPKEQISFMMEDCQPKAILCYQIKMESELPIIDLADEMTWVGDCSNPGKVNVPDDRLYCTYTSGTTGTPKGIPVRHRSEVNLITWYKEEFEITQETRNTIIAPLSFDLAQRNIFGVHTSGGMLCLYGDEEAYDAIQYAEFINQYHITMLNCAASAFYALLFADQRKSHRNLQSLKKIYLVGEALSYEKLIDFMESPYCHAAILNGYGATEDSGVASAYTVTKADGSRPSIPIGKPLNNKQIYVMDGDRLCGIGIRGEICICGVGVTEGYLNQPELTEKKFVKNPFGTGMMYRTGDLGRWLSDGNLEFLGRMDEQVKVRGYRIELGEIENSLKKIEYVKDTAVIAKEDANHENAVYAYLVSDLEINVAEIRERLLKTLPEYMVPAYIGQIERIPVTSNGKLDKKALPDLQIRGGKEYEPPENAVEETLCKIYKEVLKVERVGVNDGFFELGGHSLKALMVINRIEEELGVHIGVKEIFSSSSVKGLARIIQGKAYAVYEPIPAAEEKEYYPMSSTQKRTYIVCQIDEGGTTYHMPYIMRLTGEVNTERIEQAVQTIVNRHEILRTEFITRGGELLQCIVKNVKADYIYFEDSISTEEELIQKFIRPFNFEKAPLFRACLVKRENGYLLMFDTHHIVSDGMSMGTFLREFATLYNNEQLQPLSRQYKDYSEWMRTRDLSEQKEYWLHEFGEEVPVLDLPLDYVRPKEQSFHGAITEYKVDHELWKGIRTFAKQNGVTEYMVFLSAAMIVLSKYSGQEDIVIGSPISARTHKDTESMLGMFVNTLAMRGRPEGKKSYEEFLSEIKETCLKAYENQEYPFEELVEEIKIPRDMSRNPLFNVMLVLQNNEKSKMHLNGAEIQSLPNQKEEVKFDLTFKIFEGTESYDIVLEYCTDLFQQTTAEWINQHFSMVLQQVICNKKLRIEEIETVGEVERKQIVREFNQTYVDYGSDRTVMDLFEEQVKKTPDKIAVIEGNKMLTYRELNEKSNQLARRLREMGVQAEDFVAILAKRSIEVILEIYGTLKAGGAYVPIDPDYPKERIQYILKDCNPKVVLTYESEMVQGFPCLDLADPAIFTGDTDDLIRVNRPDNLAYCIYTSGTTGKPKGVLIEHKNLYNYIMYAREHYSSGQGCVPFFSNIAFDLTATTIFMPLVHGDSIKVYRDDVSVDEMLSDDDLTIVKMTPSHLKFALGSGLAKQQNNLECMILGGEGLSVHDSIETLRKYGTQIKIHNEYGPTETTVGCCDYIFNPEFDKAINVLIGKPIANTQIYIMNETHLCGIGIPGEICIAGAGVGRGYHNLPEETKKRFVESPNGKERMYRTGDLGRWLPDGNIECLGRIDSQVKIRGFRIELGEIENVIKKIETVKDVAVIAREDSKGDKAIYAYLVSDDLIDKQKIVRTIRKELPDYMVPNYIGQIEQIPLTSNGKVSVGNLPELNVGTTTNYIAPTTETEAMICNIFEEILSTDQVGINDDFFSLGGHSLSAVLLINRIEIAVNARVKIKDIFLNPIVRELASFIDRGVKKEYSPILKAEKKEFFPMSSSQKRTYIVSQIDGNGLAYNIPQVFRLTGEISSTRIQKALNEILKRHEILRTEFIIRENEFLQRIRENVELDYVYAEDTETEESVLVNDFQKPFVLDKAPLLRAKLIKRDHYYLFMIEIHHIISDGMSLSIFMNELAAFYNGKELPPVSCQYKDYSEWFAQQDLTQRKKYWVEQFSNGIPILDLPLDHKRPLNQSFHGDVVFISIDRELSDMIRRLTRKYEVTDYMVFLSALMILLNKYSRQEDIVVGTPVSARTHKDTEQIMGMFINTLVMRGKPEKEKEYQQFLTEIKQLCIKAYENQDFPFEELVEAIDVPRDMSRNPLFDVMLSIQNNKPAKFVLDQIQIETCHYEEKTAKFDLTFNITERKDLTYHIGLRYCTDIIKRDSAVRIVEHYIALLEQIVQNPTEVIGSYEAITEKERKLIYYYFNKTEAEYGKDKTVIDLFEEQVKIAPDRTAVEFGEKRITYSELNQRANQVARRLRDFGVNADDLIVLITEKSIETIVGIYGVLKAGAAYIPVNPEYPEKRIRFMLDDSKAKAILKYNIEPSVEEIAGIPVIDLGDETIYTGDDGNLETNVTPENLVYCIYTSGTTGKPKGVLVEHRNLMNYVSYGSKHYLSQDACMPLFSNISFDLTATTIFLPLVNGYRIKIISDDIFIDQMFEDELLTTIKLTPAHLKFVLGSKNPKVKKQLKNVILGGENLPVSDSLQLLMKYGNHIKIHNEYGPTEATIGCCDYIFDADRDTGLYVSIGKPISNVKIYILNRDSICGIGVPGELCITGDGVTRGYLNQTEYSKLKFVNNPYGPGKMYRTGDLARWTQDGNIECLGRIDQQVKIRGYRVEPGEIKNVIERYPGIKECVVSLSVRNKDEKVLNAYIVSHETIDIQELREYLYSELPNYMVPANIGQIESIPLNQNGKVDYDALERVQTIKVERKYLAPVNDTEEKLMQVWKEVLNLESVGTNDNFFDIGGTSLSIMIVYKQLEKIYPKVLKITDLFANYTIKKLSDYLILQTKAKKNFEIPAITLPYQYLANEDVHTRSSIYQSKIEKDSYTKFKDFLQKNSYQLQDVLIAVYMYWLATVTENDYIAIQAMIHKERTLQTIAINFDKVNDMGEVIESIIKEGKNTSDEAIDYHEVCQYIMKNYQKTQVKLLPLFVRKEDDVFDYLIDYYDILMEYEEKSDGIHMKFGFSGSIALDSSSELTKEYVSLLESYIDEN